MAFTLAQPGSSDLIIKKSRFIAMVMPIEDRQQAVSVVDGLRKQHPEAAHVCWAMLGSTESAAVDDGEPNGTAGRPMLDVLRHQDLQDVLAVVVRYFGGIKLGAGGLVRAYAQSTAEALRNTTRVPLVRTLTLRCQIPYSMEGILRRTLPLAAARIVCALHNEQVELAIELPVQIRQQVVDLITETTQGSVRWLDPWQ